MNLGTPEASLAEKTDPLWQTVLIASACLFLVLIGAGIHCKTVRAVAPPIYDPMSFYFRDQAVWQAVAKGDVSGLLNGPWAGRGPGSAFLLYPLGFKASTRSFVFRSVSAPILIWAIALVVAVTRFVRNRQDAALGSALCFGLLTLPLFYQFEVNPTFLSVYNVFNQWGLADALQASLAALATVLVRLGVDSRRLTFCALAWLLALLAFFVKPAGVLVIGVVGIIGAIELLIRFAQDRTDHRQLTAFGLQFLGIGFGLAVTALLLAFNSDYMNLKMIQDEIKGLKFLIAVTSTAGLPRLLGRFVQPVIGWWWFCPGVVLISWVIYRAIVSPRRLPILLRLGTSLFITTLAILWWLYLAGADQRYLFPILLMLVAWFIPDLFFWMRQLSPALRIAAGAYCLVPPLLLIPLLYLKHPSIPLQLFLGVNLSAGGYAEQVPEGNWLYSESTKIHRPLVLYFCDDYRVGVIEMIGLLRNSEVKQPNGFIVRRALNWVEQPGLRIKDFLGCDYILLEDVPPAAADQAAVDGWRQEVERFKAFAYRQHGVDRNGLELVVDGSVKILRVANPDRFKASLRAWVQTIRWNDDFAARNAGE